MVGITLRATQEVLNHIGLPEVTDRVIDLNLGVDNFNSEKEV